MITAREINGHLREAQERGLNLYWKALGDLHPVRIIGARTKKGIVQVHALFSGDWLTIDNGDAFYIQ
jgi:hypothetical protein